MSGGGLRVLVDFFLDFSESHIQIQIQKRTHYTHGIYRGAIDRQVPCSQ